MKKLVDSDVLDRISKRKIHFIIAVDKSASMNDVVYIRENDKDDISDLDNISQPSLTQTSSSKKSSDDNSLELSEKPQYTKISFKKMSNFTQASAMIMRGNLKYLLVNYVDSHKIERSELVKIEKLIPDMTGTKTSAQSEFIVRYVEIMNGLEEINQIPKIRRNFKVIKEKIQQLHNSNLDFLTDIESKELDNWLRQQSKSLWDQVVIRYRATLSKGEQFINMREVTPSILCRGVSASISCQTSNKATACVTKYISDTTSLCKICYTNPINMVFIDCKHAGTCTDCVSTFIDINTHTVHDYSCPFCKTTVSGYIKIDESQPFCTCGEIVSYYGICHHPINCRKCINDDKLRDEDKYKCHHCTSENGIDKFVEVMKINYV